MGVLLYVLVVVLLLCCCFVVLLLCCFVVLLFCCCYISEILPSTSANKSFVEFLKELFLLKAIID